MSAITYAKYTPPQLRAFVQFTEFCGNYWIEYLSVRVIDSDPYANMNIIHIILGNF